MHVLVLFSDCCSKVYVCQKETNDAWEHAYYPEVFMIFSIEPYLHDEKVRYSSLDGTKSIYYVRRDGFWIIKDSLSKLPR